MADTATIISWLIIAAGSFIGELIIPQFFLFWFGIGAVGALFAHILGVAYAYQWVVFALISAVGLFSTRSFAKAVLKGESQKSVVYELVDQEMKVTRTIDNVQGAGQVQSSGKYWRAISKDNSVIQVGTVVKVIRIEGVSLVVKQVD